MTGAYYRCSIFNARNNLRDSCVNRGVFFTLIWFYKTIPKAKKKYLKAKISYDGPLQAPIIKGNKVAQLKIYFKDEIIGNYDLLASENIKKQNILSRIITSINFLLWGDV